GNNLTSGGGITYNHLNLPQAIAMTGKGTITYTYDSAGSKLKKSVLESAVMVRVNGTDVTTTMLTTTHYLGPFLYESKVYGDAAVNDVLGYGPRLQFVSGPEGRTRPTRDVSTQAITGWVDDYFIKDHLGLACPERSRGMRMVLTDEVKQDIYPAATLETAKLSIEKGFYDIIDAQIVNKTGVNGLTDYPNNNGISNNPHDATFEATNSEKLYKLNGNGVKIGLSFKLRVMAGDKLDIFGKSYYNSANTGGTSANTNLVVSDILIGFLGGTSGNIGGHGTVTSSQLEGGATGLSSLLGTKDPAQSTDAKAYINYIFFDEQLRYAGGGFSAVDAAGTLKQHNLTNIAVPKNGWVYIYCSNESPINVFFDNLQVMHNRGPVAEETHYYPFGLTMAAISSRTVGILSNKENTFQNQRFDDELGLDWVQFKWRNHDPQIGRFIEIDPLSEEYVYNSTYAFSENKVTAHIELEGLEALSAGKPGGYLMEGFRQMFQAAGNLFQFKAEVHFNREVELKT
ncbi:MAG: hypothetical protein EOP49_33245, partial [Sphingobacteriales bacterium]